jgi:hypothetical protein
MDVFSEFPSLTRAACCASLLKVQKAAGTLMVRQNSVSFRLSLVAVLCGLYALCMTSGTRASEVKRCVIVQTADPAVFGASPLASGHLGQVSHHRTVRALARPSAPASLFKAACVVKPDFAESLLAQENVLALGGAPRAPGQSRAPPAA